MEFLEKLQFQASLPPPCFFFLLFFCWFVFFVFVFVFFFHLPLQSLFSYRIDLASIVQMLDGAIHWIIYLSSSYVLTR